MATTRTLTMTDDPLGAVRYELTFTNADGEIVDETEATHWIAEGYDAAGERVSGIHGEGPAPS